MSHTRGHGTVVPGTSTRTPANLASSPNIPENPDPQRRGARSSRGCLRPRTSPYPALCHFWPRLLPAEVPAPLPSVTSGPASRRRKSPLPCLQSRPAPPPVGGSAGSPAPGHIRPRLPRADAPVSPPPVAPVPARLSPADTPAPARVAARAVGRLPVSETESRPESGDELVSVPGSEGRMTPDGQCAAGGNGAEPGVAAGTGEGAGPSPPPRSVSRASVLGPRLWERPGPPPAEWGSTGLDTRHSGVAVFRPVAPGGVRSAAASAPYTARIPNLVLGDNHHQNPTDEEIKLQRDMREVPV
ncbi:skin secretory protein xP2-like [Meles meles]|uniref:skin secretory protein xP2-like n=1 Tax=Meles meles TaxID=9662 RepID=UPI001E69A750|nr:skin secretory protein xP2-like [Meles meles]